jgi:hypothetical protein
MIRTIVLVLIAFVAGLLYERSNMADACLGLGGAMHDGVCWNE